MLQRRSAHIPQADDIADNPSLLYNNTLPRDQMSLHGVHLGDPSSAIGPLRIAKQADGGWIVCTDGSRYRVENGVVTTLGLWDYPALDRLNIHSRDQIESVFGPPQAVLDAGQVYVYRFDSGHVTVLWHRFEDRIIGINVSSDITSSTKPS